MKWSCGSPRFNAMSFDVASLHPWLPWETNYAATFVLIPSLPSPSVEPTPIQPAASMLIESPGQLTSSAQGINNDGQVSGICRYIDCFSCLPVQQRPNDGFGQTGRRL